MRQTITETETANEGRLLARPPLLPVSDGHALPGMQTLGLAAGRDGVIYVPEGYDPTRPAPLLVLFHGAGGEGRAHVASFQAFADQTGIVLLGPDSRGRTWDVILGGFGPDVDFVDRALSEVFGRISIDPELVAAGGFSDGATYALSIGLTNGDFFSRIVAFSPGYLDPAELRARPPVFISHGIEDRVLPIDRCSRRIVPALRGVAYEVVYREFEDGHTVPPGIARDAFAWLLDPTPA